MHLDDYSWCWKQRFNYIQVRHYYVLWSGHFLRLFRAFNLQDSEDCAQDFMEIRQNDRGGRLVSRLCANAQPGEIKVEEQAWLRFRSDEDGTASGFELFYNLGMLIIIDYVHIILLYIYILYSI